MEQYQIKIDNPTARIKIGSFYISLYNKRFNWFHRKMMKLFFGWDVENLDDPIITGE